MSQVEIVAYRAQPIGDQDIPETTIRIAGAFPDPPQRLTGNVALHDRDAHAIAQALANSLPGGTFHRLVGKLLAMKASQFVVKHDWPEEKK